MGQIAGIDAVLRLPPKISLSVPLETAVEGREIPLYITVDHMGDDAIDQSSFLLDGKALDVIILTNEAANKRFSNDLQTSRFKALLPAKSSGLYKIGPVSVKVGMSRFSSGSISIHVQQAVKSEALRLESDIKAPPHIYPGQEITFEYRIYFFGPLQLFREDLPLLNPPGFRTTTSPTITTKTVQDQYIQIISQTARAEKVGAISVGESVIEGMSITTVGGKPQPIPPLLRATAPPVNIEVLQFPQPIPDEFQGSLGSFLWRPIVDQTTVSVNEPISVQYIVSGRGDLSTVQFPPFSQIPDLQSSFWATDTPPLGEEKDGVKKFTLTLRPKYVGKQKIPGFTFCSFDPISQTFIKIPVSGVVITVEGKAESAPFSGAEDITKTHFDLGNQKKESAPFSLKTILYLALGAIILIVIEMIVQKVLSSLKKKKPKRSTELFYQAIMNRGKVQQSLQGLKEAFLLRLFEVRLIPSPVTSVEDLHGDGIVADVKHFLQSIDKQLYHKEKASVKLQDLYDEASFLYNRLKNISV